jgi:hypothetical protein
LQPDEPAPAKKPTEKPAEPAKPAVLPAEKPAEKPETAEPAEPSDAEEQSTCPDGQLAVLETHNSYRMRTGSPPLLWSNNLARIAQEWSEACVFQHSVSAFGENLAIGVALDNCSQAVDLWMTESVGPPGSAEPLNHASQVLWPDTIFVGCGWAPACRMVTCNYDPAGNVVKE